MWCGKTDGGRASQKDVSGCDLPTADVTATRRVGGGGDREITGIVTRGAERSAVAELFLLLLVLLFPFPNHHSSHGNREKKQKGNKTNKTNKNKNKNKKLCCHFSSAAATVSQTSRLWASSSSGGGQRTLTTGKCTDTQPTRSNNKARGTLWGGGNWGGGGVKKRYREPICTYMSVFTCSLTV